MKTYAGGKIRGSRLPVKSLAPGLGEVMRPSRLTREKEDTLSWGERDWENRNINQANYHINLFNRKATWMSKRWP